MKKKKNILILWYSQSGHTRRIGRLLSMLFRKRNISATASDIRDFREDSFKDYSLIILGSPVMYADLPLNVTGWLERIPGIDGIPVASFVTYGGSGSNQENTAKRTLALLEKKGGIPVAWKTFGNMSTFAQTWSSGNAERVLRFSHLPNEEDTYRHVREFADALADPRLTAAAPGTYRSFDPLSPVKGKPLVRLHKLLIRDHHIRKENCDNCQQCVRGCPVQAISPGHDIDRGRCILCLGCINNCPRNAVAMTFLGKEMYGFKELLARNEVSIREPLPYGEK